jgi:hypothetical protein
MAVHIRHTRQHEPVELDLILRRSGTRNDGNNLAILNVDLDILRNAGRQQCVVGTIDLHTNL